MTILPIVVCSIFIRCNTDLTINTPIKSELETTPQVEKGDKHRNKDFEWDDEAMTKSFNRSAQLATR